MLHKRVHAKSIFILVQAPLSGLSLRVRNADLLVLELDPLLDLLLEVSVVMIDRQIELTGRLSNRLNNLVALLVVWLAANRPH